MLGSLQIQYFCQTLVIVNIAKTMLCHSQQCYHCLLHLSPQAWHRTAPELAEPTHPNPAQNLAIFYLLEPVRFKLWHWNEWLCKLISLKTLQALDALMVFPLLFTTLFTILALFSLKKLTFLFHTLCSWLSHLRQGCQPCDRAGYFSPSFPLL